MKQWNVPELLLTRLGWSVIARSNTSLFSTPTVCHSLIRR
jgi:hypothetical protein